MQIVISNYFFNILVSLGGYTVLLLVLWQQIVTLTAMNNQNATQARPETSLVQMRLMRRTEMPSPFSWIHSSHQVTLPHLM